MIIKRKDAGEKKKIKIKSQQPQQAHGHQNVSPHTSPEGARQHEKYFNFGKISSSCGKKNLRSAFWIVIHPDPSEANGGFFPPISRGRE